MSELSVHDVRDVMWFPGRNCHPNHYVKTFPRFDGYGDVLYLTLLLVLPMTSFRELSIDRSKRRSCPEWKRRKFIDKFTAPIHDDVRRITLWFDNFHRCRRHKAG